jgi:hypothetical protein
MVPREHIVEDRRTSEPRRQAWALAFEVNGCRGSRLARRPRF